MNNLYRRDGWVKSTLGPAIPGAQIWVCSQPANTDFLPPVPLVSVFSDPAGLVPVTQPIITDGFGHYDYYVAPGLYTEIVAFGGKVQKVYPDQSLGNVGTAGTSPLVLSTNGTPNFNQTALNFIQGSGIAISSDNLGNVTFTGSTTSRTAAITYVIDGGGSAVSTGVKGQLSIPLACTLTGWVITADQSGSAVVDVLRSTYAGFPTTASIAGSDKPTLATAQKNEDLSLSGWGSTAVNAGDELQFNVNSASTITRINITLNVSIP